jgi:hypothetical protein
MPQELIKLRDRLQTVLIEAEAAVNNRSPVGLDEHGRKLSAEGQAGYLSHLRDRLAALSREIAERQNVAVEKPGKGSGEG